MRELRRLGIIGVGVAGRARARAIRARPDLELVGAYRGRFLAPLQIPAFASVDALLAAVDGVIIASPNHTHSALIHRALQAEVHVCVEFPAVPPQPGAPQELATLFERASRQQQVLHVEHIELLSPVTKTLKQHLKSAQITRIDCRFSRNTSPGGPLSFAAASLPRLHRITALAGPVLAVHNLTLKPHSFVAELATERCEHVSLTIEQSPAHTRQLSLQIHTAAGHHFDLTGGTLSRNHAPIRVPKGDPLFAQDLDVFVNRVKGNEHYVSEQHLLHILQISSQIASL